MLNVRWYSIFEIFSTYIHQRIRVLSNFLRKFSDRPGVTDPRKVENLTNKVISSLKEHTTYHPQAKNKPNYFARVVEKLQTVQVLRREGLYKICCMITELSEMGHHHAPIPQIIREIASQMH